jgi:nucleoid-associated protein YgaU
VRATRILTVAGVLGAGVCAAWPFRQREPRIVDPPQSAVPLEIMLRGPDVTLTGAPASTTSPAVGLEAARESYGGSRSLVTKDGGERLVDLENLAPPPELALAYQPASNASAPTQKSRPQSVQSRTYRLRDGDTLEMLAERLLGTRDRATEIFELNRDVLSRPDLLPVGRTLVIPPRELAQSIEPPPSEGY